VEGSPNPALVQRIAAWMFGLVFMGGGLELLYQAVSERLEDGFSIAIVIMTAMSLAAVLIGIGYSATDFAEPEYTHVVCRIIIASCVDTYPNEQTHKHHFAA
jgi:hypothetical protein